MTDTAEIIKTDKQYKRLLNLCARAFGTVNKFIELGLITDMGDGKYKVKVMYKHYYLYEMIYDGKRITEYARLIF